MHRRRIGLFAILALVGTAPRPAGAVEDLLTPRSVSMGNSLIADATGALGPLLNPAGMALRRSYTLELMYGYRVQDQGSNLLAAIVDSVTSRVAAGIWYGFVHNTPAFHFDPRGPVVAKREGHETGLSLAMLLGDYFSLGLSAKYVRITTDAPNPLFDPNANPATPDRVVIDSTTSAASADGFTMDVGANFRLGQFSLGVVGYNLVPLHSIDAPIALGTGLAYHLGETLTLATDFVVNFNKYKDFTTGDSLTTFKLGGGLEWLIKGRFAVRAGSFWDSGRPGTYVTGGLAYVGQRFAVDVAYKQEVQHGTESLILGGIRVFLQ